MSAYWSTVAQIAGVFIIPLVLEARRAAARWSSKTRRIQRIQGAFFYFSAISLAMTIVFSVVFLGMRRAPTAVDIAYHAFTLGVVAVGLVLPLVTYATAPILEDMEILSRALPWSKWRRDRRRFRKAEAAFRRSVQEVLDMRDRFDASQETSAKLIAALQVTVSGLSRSVDPEDVRKVLLSVDSEGLSPEEVEQVRGIAMGQKSAMKAAAKEDRRLAKMLDDHIARQLAIVESFDADREAFTKMNYIAPEFRAQVDRRIAELESDARDEVASHIREETAKPGEDE